MFIKKALEILRPSGSYDVIGNGGMYSDIIWKDSGSNIPSKDEVESVVMDLRERTRYSENREMNYPSEKDMVVALWESIVEHRSGSLVNLQKARNDVKLRFPKLPL